MVKYPLTGGLDLTTVKPLVKPGSLKECLNYEVSTTTGYTRIGGIARFDGSEDVGSYKIWRLKYAGTQPFVIGQSAWFNPSQPGTILDLAVQDGNGVIYLMVPGSHPNPSLPADLSSSTAIASILQREAVFDGHGTQATFNTAVDSIESAQRGNIGQVPGRKGSDIIGGFWYKDRLYVLRDLPRIAFQNGYYTDADEGKYITLEGQSYKVLDVAITGDNQGVLTYDTQTGGPNPQAVPIGSAELVTLPVTGDYGPGYTYVPYYGDLNVSGGVPPYTWSVAGEEGLALDPINAIDANAINFLPQLTNAALYRSGAAGWERVNLGREIRFRNGTSAIVNFKRSAVLTGSTVLNTGYHYPGTGKLNGAATTALGADDGVEAALAAGLWNEFQATNFDFSSIPDNASIQGIEVIVERRSTSGNPAKDQVVNLLGVEGGTSNKAKAGNWPTTSTATTYGSETDLWGSQYITTDVIKDPAFGVRIIAARGTVGVDASGGIDRVQVRVFYIERDSKVYCWNGSTDIEFTLHHAQITSGVATDSTAQGYMSVSGLTNADKARLVNEGEEIRTAPAGGGTLLALVAERDRPIWLAGQAEVDNNRARYQFERTNFYGQDEFEAVYGVCGASPAFSFDGQRCIRIRAELPANQDLPRHIVRHGDMLALGYYSGAVLFTKVGDPHETRGSEGASAVEVGDRLTGLVPLAGDALGVICQSQTQVLRGTTPESMLKSPISAKRGGIEYTAVDMGRIVLCDGLGIFLADSPESFGAATRSYMSMPVHPWLRPRLQATISSESAFLRPVAALNVRHKNQMRLYFWDGWVLTMTMNEPPEFTTQRYFTPAADAHSEPVPWVPRMLCSGIDSSGRERIFASFFGGVKDGYVFELDAGRSFDGDPIPAHVVLNPLTIDSSSREKRYDRAFIYGHGYGLANVTFSRSSNDSDSFAGTHPFKMGRTDWTAKIESLPLRGVVDSPIEAFDICMRFESNTKLEGPHTLQYIEAESDNRGESRGRQGERK